MSASNVNAAITAVLGLAVFVIIIPTPGEAQDKLVLKSFGFSPPVYQISEIWRSGSNHQLLSARVSGNYRLAKTHNLARCQSRSLGPSRGADQLSDVTFVINLLVSPRPSRLGRLRRTVWFRCTRAASHAVSQSMSPRHMPIDDGKCCGPRRLDVFATAGQ